MYVWSGSWACPGPLRNLLLRPRLVLHCCVNQNFYLCLEGNVWITKCPFLLPALSWGLFVICCCCVSSYLSLSRNLGTAYVSQPRVTLAGVQLPPYKAFPVLATRAALSAKNNNTMLLPFMMCNHEENYKKEM